MINKRYNELMNILMESVYGIYDRQDEAKASAHWKRGDTPAGDEIIVTSKDKKGNRIKSTVSKAGTKRFKGARKAFPHLARGSSDYRESRQDEAKYESGQSPDVKTDMRNFRSGKGTLTRREAHKLKRGHKKKSQGSPEMRIPASEQTPLQKSIGGNITKETLKYNLMKSRQARKASKFKNESYQNISEGERRKDRVFRAYYKSEPGSEKGEQLLKAYTAAKSKLGRRNNRLVNNVKASRWIDSIDSRAREKVKRERESRQDEVSHISEGERRDRRVFTAYLKTEPGSEKAKQLVKASIAATKKLDRRNNRLVSKVKAAREIDAITRRSQERRDREKEND
jgi:hypothetical protein